MPDHLTVLTCKAPMLATKLWTEQGTITPTPAPKHFTHSRVRVGGLEDLRDALLSLSSEARSLVIRDDPTSSGVILRRRSEVEPVDHHWLMIDVDDYEPACGLDDPVAAAGGYIRGVLPEEFHWAGYVLQLSASFGHPGSAGVLKAHLWFWLREPASSASLYAWAKGVDGVDAAVFRPVQAHYTAGPVIDDGLLEMGLDDPYAGRRVVLVPGGDVDLGLDAAPEGGVVEVGERRASDMRDPVGGWLLDEGRAWLRGVGEDGRIDVFCPWRSEHGSGDGVESSTSYFPAGVGRGRAGFKCQHEGCGGREGLEEFLEAAGVPREVLQEAGVVASGDEFDVLPPDVPECVGVRGEALAKVEAEIAGALGERMALEGIVQRVVKHGALEESDKRAVLGVLHEAIRDAGGEPGRKDSWIKRALRVVRPPQVLAGWGLEKWVFLADRDRLLNTETGQVRSIRGWSMEHNHLAVRGDSGKIDPFITATEVHNFPVVDSMLAAPGYPPVVEFAGKTLANSYRDMRPERVRGGEGDEAVRRWQEFFEWAFPDERERGLLLSWLSWVALNPGQKILWAPHLVSMIGAGKGAISKWLMGAVLGPTGVSVARAGQLSGRFNSWAVAAPLVVLDELQQAGSKIDLGEQLKTYITEERLEIEHKGVDVMQMPNLCNYIATSNDPYSWPLDLEDRRGAVFRIPRGGRDISAAREAGMYDALKRDADRWPGHLRDWLCNIEPHAEFTRRAAPYTKMSEMVWLEGFGVDTGKLLDLLEEGGPGVSVDLFSSACLTDMAARRGVETPSTSAQKHTFSKMGYEAWSNGKGRRTKIGRHPHTLWAQVGTEITTSIFDEFKKGLATWENSEF